MKHEDFLKELRRDPEYVAAEKELKPMLDIANDVLRLRLEKGWTQSELARRARTRQANISKLENGLGNPTIHFLRKVAQALETELTIGIGPKQKIEATRVVIKQEVRIVQLKSPWGNKNAPKRSTATKWIGFATSLKPLNQVDQYEAA